MVMPTTPPSVYKHTTFILAHLLVSTSTQCSCLPHLQRCECLCHQQPRFHCRQSAGRSVMLRHHLLPEVKHCHNIIHTKHTHTRTHIRTNTHASAHAYTHTYVYIYIHTQCAQTLYTHTHKNMCIHTYMCAHTYTHTHTHTLTVCTIRKLQCLQKSSDGCINVIVTIMESLSHTVYILKWHHRAHQDCRTNTFSKPFHQPHQDCKIPSRLPTNKF